MVKGLKCVLVATGLASLTLPLFAQDSAERRAVDASASWGVDLDSGKIAVDAYLLYYHDPDQGVLIVNGLGYNEALAEAGATLLRDGSWLMPDGSTLKPLVSEVTLLLGDEPPELAGMVTSARQTDVARIQLTASTTASARAQKVRWFKRCNRCEVCLTGCFDRTLAQGGDFKTCGSGGFFSRCKEQRQVGACNPLINFACAGCTGAVTGTEDLFVWGCAPGC